MPLRLGASFGAAAACGLVLAAVAPQSAPVRAQPGPALPVGRQIVIRVLEAHTGKPIAREPLGVWLEKGIVRQKSPLEPPTYFTNKDGNAVVSLPLGTGTDDLSLLVLHDIPCEPYNNIDYLLDYSIEKILTHGVVSDNVCGKTHHVAEPGVLIVFVKHRPWWQIGTLAPSPLRTDPGDRRVAAGPADGAE